MLLCASSLAGAEPRQDAETGRDLGFGFREVFRSQTNPPGGFEGVGHFRFLYYRNEQLSQFNTYSIAPTGRYVVFQDGPSGDIVLFTAASQKRRVLQQHPGARVRRYTWKEGERAVVFELAPVRVSLE